VRDVLHPLANVKAWKTISVEGRVWALAVSPSKKLLAVGTWNGHIYVLRWEMGKAVFHDTLQGAILTASFSPNGKYLAVSGCDCEVHLFEVTSGRKIATAEVHCDRIHSLAFSPNSALLVTASDDNTCCVLRVPDLQLMFRFKEHRSAVRAVAFISNDAILSADTSGLVLLWSLKRRASLISVRVPYPVGCISVCNSGVLLGTSRAVYALETETFKKRKVASTGAVYAVFGYDDGTTIWRDNTGLYFLTQSAKPRLISRTLPGPLLVLKRDNQYFLFVGERGKVAIRKTVPLLK